jgi:D-xylose 1-dehydrogenase (NADP+, D-xylono-1,5-lactone-forming)
MWVSHRGPPSCVSSAVRTLHVSPVRAPTGIPARDMVPRSKGAAVAATQRLRWGVLGTGNIARQFAAGVNASALGQILAVGSRQREAAEAFAGTYHIPHFYGDYEGVLGNRDVDAVYVSLPNSLHHRWTLAALAAGKHVLCEKPFSVTAAEAEEMFDAARRAGRVVMEAFMYRCHPLTHAVQAAVAGGAIGRVKLIRTSFCFRTTRVADNVRFRPDLAGGAMMDVGCYCLSFARLFAGREPDEVYATGHLHEAGVDDLASGVLRFGDNLTATFSCGMTVQADNTAYLCGDEGYIEIPVPWKPPVRGAQYTIARSTPPRMDQKALGAAAPPKPPRETFTVDAGVELYGMEADDFAGSVLDGKPVRVSREDTVGNMRLLERIRRMIGLAY